MVKIIDNFLPEQASTNINDLLTGENFPWYFNNYKSSATIQELFEYQFIHIFYDKDIVNSDHFNSLKPLLNKLNCLSLIRIKANLNVRTEKQFLFEKHQDQDFDCKVAIFYLNSNDGYTLINNKEIKSVKNRMLFFNNEWHSSSTTTDQPNRIVINFNYF